MPACPAQRALQQPQAVDLDEALVAAPKLSGVSRERFEAIDNLPPSKLFVAIGTEDSPRKEAHDLVVQGVAAKWNAWLGDCGSRLRGKAIFFDEANPLGTEATRAAGFRPGSVLLVRRGGCSLSDKGLHAAASGASAVLVCDVEPGRKPGIMGEGLRPPSIPGFMISMEAGAELAEILRAGCKVRIGEVEARSSSFFDAIGGEAPVRKLIAAFYRRVFSDPEAWFREIFDGRDETEAVENLADFLIERFGGPNYYAQKKGPAALIARHMPFNIQHGSAERWLQHMAAALAEVDAFDGDAGGMLMDYLRYQAHFIGYTYLRSRGVPAYDEASAESRALWGAHLPASCKPPGASRLPAAPSKEVEPPAARGAEDAGQRAKLQAGVGAANSEPCCLCLTWRALGALTG